jgi:hypothetical protein
MYSDIETVDEIIEAGCGTNIVAAWGRIKKKHAEALKPSHNKQSTPCFHSAHRGTNAKIIYCDKCGAVIG